MAQSRSRGAPRRSTDETFVSLINLCGEGILKLLSIPEEQTTGYTFRPVVLKEKRLEPDVEAIPIDLDRKRIFLEFQGYKDPYIRYRLCAEALWTCAHEKDRRPVVGGIIYTEETFQEVALPLHEVLGWPKLPSGEGFLREVVLERYSLQQLREVDPRLVVLWPFTVPRKTPKGKVLAQASHIRGEIESHYSTQDQPLAWSIVGLLLLARFRHITREEIMRMLNFDLKDSVAGQEIFTEGIEIGRMEGMEKGRMEGIEIGIDKGRKKGRMEGRKKGRQEGRAEGRAEDILDILSERFGSVPDDLAQTIREIGDYDRMGLLLRKAIRVESLEAFQEALTGSGGASPPSHGGAR